MKTSQTETMTLIDLSMSNLDHSIDEGMAEELQAKPREVYGYYYGWHFCSRVWFDETFHAEVWVHGVPHDVIQAETLEAIMDKVCDSYGGE